MNKATIKRIQTILGTKADAIWGPKSQAALNRAISKTSGRGSRELARIQRMLGVKENGCWELPSQMALNKELAGSVEFSATATSFADPADVVAFQRCKAQGKTDRQCFAVGDNGIGQFGKITAQKHTPMVAVHADDMVAKWGSVNAAAHRSVRVTVNGLSVSATVEDRIGMKGRIDLNPAVAAALGLKPPFKVPCRWSWA